MIVPFVVTFIGDFFSTTVAVEVDTDEPDISGYSAGQLEEVAQTLAQNIMKYHYGWNVARASTDIEVRVG